VGATGRPFAESRLLLYYLPELAILVLQTLDLLHDLVQLAVGGVAALLPEAGDAGTIVGEESFVDVFASIHIMVNLDHFSRIIHIITQSLSLGDLTARVQIYPIRDFSN